MPQVPEVTRPCNRFPCPDSITTWATGPWGPCLAVQGTALGCSSLGSQARNVTCQSAITGTTLPDAVCLANGGTSGRPPASAGCPLQSPCACTSRSDCPSGQWECRVDTHQCGCATGWAGQECSTRLLVPASSQQCLGGVADVAGVCCLGLIDVVTGLCCGGDGLVDKSGRCCTSPIGVDACGVCGGSGVAVDALGVCCATPLPASGLCCPSGVLDSCGVCDGDNQCRMAFAAHLSPHWLASNSSVITLELVSATLGVPLQSIVAASVESWNSSLEISGDLVVESASLSRAGGRLDGARMLERRQVVVLSSATPSPTQPGPASVSPAGSATIGGATPPPPPTASPPPPSLVVTLVPSSSARGPSDGDILGRALVQGSFWLLADTATVKRTAGKRRRIQTLPGMVRHPGPQYSYWCVYVCARQGLGMGVCIAVHHISHR
jgi:hypothetical protein